MSQDKMEPVYNEVLIAVYVLRSSVAKYRAVKRQEEISTHVCAIDIVLALTELAIRNRRRVESYEENWFSAGLYLHYTFDGSPYEDIADQFDRLVEVVRQFKYFRAV